MSDIRSIAAKALTERGIDPAAVADTAPPKFDPVTFYVERARRMLAAHIPPEFADATPDHPAVVGWVAQYLTAPAEAPSLLLNGITGVGKTWQAWGALRAVVEALAGAGRAIRWQATTHPDLNDALRRPDRGFSSALDPLLDADLLMLDDLGAGKQSEWAGDALLRLVDHRWANHLPTIYSTNLTRKDLVDAVGDRVVSRLSTAVVVNMRGTDRRRESAL